MMDFLMLAYAAQFPRLASSMRTGFANGKPLNSGATGHRVHTYSTTKSATGASASNRGATESAADPG
jgi:hypothetical protein